MRERSGLLTDLYELTMAAGYLQTGFEARATFELFVRNLPSHRNYLVAAGLEQALDFLEHVNFNDEEVAYLRSHHVFQYIGPQFFEYLRTFRFTGDVWAVPEGTLVFPGEPMLRVSAPIIEAQIMETYLLATLAYQTMIASKTARVVTAAEGRRVVEFGARRAHSAQAGLFAARAAAIGGAVGSSNVLAGQQFGVYTYGTQAHSWVMAHDDEADAFAHFLDAFPERAFLLLDTYNVHDAVKKIIRMGRKPAGVRLDSGDVAKDSRWVRRELDKAGWQDVRIFASGDLDEYEIAKLLSKGAAIDSFGVGSALATPSDAPLLNLVYKLVEVERAGKIHEAAKLTQAKVTYPGRKQVFRYVNRAGQYESDRIALDNEPANGGKPLLVTVMKNGRRIAPPEPIEQLRERCVAELECLSERYRRIDRQADYPVRYSKQLEKLLDKIRKRVRRSAPK
jgi:nicotinate phosphoribosyltransferase